MKMISFFVVARNGGQTIGNLFEDLKNQSYPHQQIEVVLVDGRSSDDTRQQMETLAQHSDFSRVLVLDNPKQTLPAGWNLALAACRGEIIVRVDAHGRIPADFLDRIAADFQAGEHIVGGLRTSVVQQETPWQKTLLLAETALFGSGIAVYRRAEHRHYVHSVAHGAYGREVFGAVGGYDERLKRTEDNDMHCRMRRAGFRILFDPAVRSTHHVRSSLGRMVRQKFANGLWIGLSLCIQPGCFRPYHFAPLFFVLALLLTGTLAAFDLLWPLVLLAGVYLTVNISMAVLSLVGKQFELPYLLLPLLFLLLHLSYGLGTLLGLLGAPFYRLTHPDCPEISRVREQLQKEAGR